MITRLDGASARKISAGQVITDLTSVVKELLENALDAHARTVRIRLVSYGLDEITVEDDGTGIPVGPVVDLETGKLHDNASTPLLSSRASTKHCDAKGESDGVALSSFSSQPRRHRRSFAAATAVVAATMHLQHSPTTTTRRSPVTRRSAFVARLCTLWRT